MKKLLFALLALVVLSVGWFILIRPGSKVEAPASEQSADTNIPVKFQPGGDLKLVDHNLSFGNFGFSYPEKWNLVEGANNSDKAQIITLESPMDAHEFYYCIDFNEYSAAQAGAVDFTAKDIEILETEDFTATGIGKPLKLVTYRTSNGMILTTVTDDLTATKEKRQFQQSIVNPAGRTVQLFGRYNCRDENRPTLMPADYLDGQVYKDGYQILQKLKY
jgi:hypothetical protein